MGNVWIKLGQSRGSYVGETVERQKWHGDNNVEHVWENVDDVWETLTPGDICGTHV